MTWSTRAAAIAALRTRMQDEDVPRRYTETELGIAVDQAVAEIGRANPILATVDATVPPDRLIRLDGAIGAATFGAVVYARDITQRGAESMVIGWQYYERDGAHHIIIPAAIPVGGRVEVVVHGGYGFAIATALGGATVVIDTNIPAEWRELTLDGAEGFLLELYGKREIGRANVPAAMAQQSARAAAVKLRDFRQALANLPPREPRREIVTWGLADIDAAGFD